ncbi:hypothetical protein [Siphonobacter sp. SORGH_AS_1065]|uniref:hypothetical protein n=1 Tax=Siphonobacter sp. SORGH_AS_1065 TaxID=3041795 RepID=UPI00278A21ED|nr:hypothetical protein [Siphonobacter sp. SORGH_AS_1065]MDQ1089575.1 hypothetical protein [Siphonobacter sp. SORGH_AS_1065]
MKRVITVFIFLLSLTQVKAQKFAKEKAEINGIVDQFRTSISKKDSVTFLRLFTPQAFVWIGVMKNQNQFKKVIAKKPDLKNYFSVGYDTFYKFLGDKGTQEEIFKNVRITNDDVIGSVTFDYEYWNDGKMTNWGKEFWHLIKMDNEWKMVSVIFSIAE